MGAIELKIIAVAYFKAFLFWIHLRVLVEIKFDALVCGVFSQLSVIIAGRKPLAVWYCTEPRESTLLMGLHMGTQSNLF